jgi:hypothetical protein
VESENNYTLEIEEVVNEQRNLIAEEMLGYRYPAGLYNISARFVLKIPVTLPFYPTEIYILPLLAELCWCRYYI